MNDPRRAPAGRGMFHRITTPPYNLEDGGPQRWDEIRERMGDRSLRHYQKMVGPLLHPGGGGYRAGRATAKKMMDVLHLDFDWLATAKVG
jgi:hypothetical protein